jgi:hypothetical protein
MASVTLALYEGQSPLIALLADHGRKHLALWAASAIPVRTSGRNGVSNKIPRLM